MINLYLPLFSPNNYIFHIFLHTLILFFRLFVVKYTFFPHFSTKYTFFPHFSTFFHKIYFFFHIFQTFCRFFRLFVAKYTFFSTFFHKIYFFSTFFQIFCRKIYFFSTFFRLFVVFRIFCRFFRLFCRFFRLFCTFCVLKKRVQTPCRRDLEGFGVIWSKFIVFFFLKSLILICLIYQNSALVKENS